MQRAPRRVVETPHHLTLSGRRVAVLLRHSPRARRITVKVEPAHGRVVVVIPPRTALARALAFAEANGPWILNRLAQVPHRIAFAPGAQIPIKGLMVTIDHRAESRGTVWREGDLLCVAGGHGHVARRVRDWLIGQARAEIKRAVAFYAEQLGVSVKSVTVRDTASRWGSCAASGALSFSWRLILAPPDVLNYVAAHEVAHRKELSHSPRFWRIVGQIFPGYEAPRAWLRDHGTDLHRFGAVRAGAALPAEP